VRGGIELVFQGFIKTLKRLFPFLLSGIHCPESVVRLGIIRVSVDGFFVILYSVIQLSLVRADNAEHIIGLFVVAVCLKRAVKFDRRELIIFRLIM
jgi:hypothetical protein